MPLTTYKEVRPWGRAIREAVVSRAMPPWFADSHFGQFSNNPSLSNEEIAKISAWVYQGFTLGNPADAPAPRVWIQGWTIGKPDAVFEMPQPIVIPAKGELDYQYATVATRFTEDRWVQKVELRPGTRGVVHHAVVYIREPGSAWSGHGVTKSDILFTYSPGNSHDEWPRGMAKFIPAGAELIFQMHYTPNGHETTDRSRIGVAFAAAPPRERVLTLQLDRDRLAIPPGRPDYEVSVSGSIPGEARLLSLFPHMHLRGKRFEYTLRSGTGPRRVLLKINDYNFYWQLTYRLAEPIPLHPGDVLECTAMFDNSKNNPRNPDPDAFVTYGEQSSDEMMVGFFDITVDASVSKQSYFDQRAIDYRK